MIVDSDGLEAGAALDAAVCVIGAGSAGIPLAVELGRAGIDVHLLEAGGLEASEESQSLYEGESVGVAYHPRATRLRYFGGSMNHWGGMCRPLDAWDFEAHDWIPESGWPIDRATLDPFYRRAQEVLDLARFEYRFEALERDPVRHPRLLGRDHRDFDSVVWQRAYRMRVGEKYREEIEQSARITCFLHAGATEIVPDPKGERIERVEVKSRSGRALRFRARHFVLATGGLENPRMLLLSDSVVPAGLGNRHDLVGRYFMEHPNQHIGWMYVVPTPEAVAFQEEVLQRGGELFPGLPYNIVGLASSRSLQQERRLQGWSINLQGAVHPLKQLDSAAGDIEEALAAPLSGWLDEARTRKVRPYKLGCVAEQRPDPASRVRLGRARDRLGLRKLVVDWRLADEDLKSLKETTLKLGIALARSGSARLRLHELDSLDWMPGGSGGHHMGTTRMSDDPRRGVTDRHARVHGLANLHVAGSSLFPTGGYANPTLTLVALALRLADRLAAMPELRG